MIREYEICRIGVSISAPYFPEGNSDWVAFEKSNVSDSVKIECRIADTLPDPIGNFCGEIQDARVYSDGVTVSREIRMGTEDGALTFYSINNSDSSVSHFTHKSFGIMADYRFMWNSICLPQLFLRRNVFFLHASYIVVNGKAIIFSAPCGTGKSTQAALWEKYRGAVTVNGDKVGISVGKDGVFAHGVPFCGTSGICKNISAPLGAIIFIAQAHENKINKADAADSIQMLLKNTYLDFLAPDEQLRFVDLAIAMLEKVPVYSLGCTPDERAVAALETKLIAEGVM
ncbi:MAG: hypothetical protein IKB88_01655 [Clostridia bacterium]|nr:hypothetical protein [Clostridia bacterium]